MGEKSSWGSKIVEIGRDKENLSLKIRIGKIEIIKQAKVVNENKKE